jgi:hypothetical protein
MKWFLSVEPEENMSKLSIFAFLLDNIFFYESWCSSVMIPATFPLGYFSLFLVAVI